MGVDGSFLKLFRQKEKMATSLDVASRVLNARTYTNMKDVYYAPDELRSGDARGSGMQHQG